MRFRNNSRTEKDRQDADLQRTSNNIKFWEILGCTCKFRLCHDMNGNWQTKMDEKWKKPGRAEKRVWQLQTDVRKMSGRDERWRWTRETIDTRCDRWKSEAEIKGRGRNGGNTRDRWWMDGGREVERCDKVRGARGAGKDVMKMTIGRETSGSDWREMKGSGRGGTPEEV